MTLGLDNTAWHEFDFYKSIKYFENAKQRKYLNKK
jgi:hypothetical protein